MAATNRILVCDDHEIVREGLRARIEAIPGCEVVGEAADGSEVISKVRSLRPDLVLIDVEMPKADGITAASRIAESWPETRVLIFTAHEGKNVVGFAARSGASGYLLKSASAAELRKACEAVLAGETWFPGHAPTRGDETDELERLKSLSARERQILDLLADGMRAQGVADEIGIRPATVYTHVRNVVSKLGVDTRTQAVAIATRYRFLESGD